MVLEFIYAETGIDVNADRIGVARTSIYFGGWILSVEDQQGIYKLAMDVCEYIFEYDSHSDNAQQSHLQVVFNNIIKFYDDIKIGVISESIWTEKCDDTHT